MLPLKNQCVSDWNNDGKDWWALLQAWDGQEHIQAVSISMPLALFDSIPYEDMDDLFDEVAEVILKGQG